MDLVEGIHGHLDVGGLDAGAVGLDPHLDVVVDHAVAVILPQAIPPVIPALGNYLIAMFKDTPLLSAITVLEMLQRAKIVSAESFRYVEPLTIVGLAFLVVSLIAAIPVRRLERNLRTPGA